MLLLGSIYALGALLTMADLRGEGATIRDALQLVPLEQLLARGIGTALGVLAALAGMAAFAGLWSAWQTAGDTVRPPGADTAADPPRAFVLYGLALIVISAGIFLAGAVVPALIGVGILVGASVFGLLASGTWTTHRQDIAIGLVFVLVGLAAHAYFAPHPLAKVRLDVERGPDVTGALISIADGRWHLITARGQIVVVPDESVTEAGVTAGSPHWLHSPLSSIVDLPLPLIAIFGVLALVPAGFGIRFLVIGVRDARSQDRSADGVQTPKATQV